MSIFKESFLRPDFSAPTDGKPRIQFVDLAKGVCIILVVVLHTYGVHKYVPEWLELLRMPLYFMLSGLFFKDYGGWAMTALKKVNRLLVPFIFFVLLETTIAMIEHYMDVGQWDTSQYFALFHGKQIPNTPMWFLLCLFNVNLLFSLIALYLPKEWMRATAVAVACALGMVFHPGLIKEIFGPEAFVPFYFDTACSAMPFFYLGYLLRRTPLLVPNRYDIDNPLFGAILVGLAVWIFNKGEGSHLQSLYNLWWGNRLYALVSSMMMVVGTLLILKNIRWLPYVSYMGRYSVIVLCLHHPMIFRIGGALRNAGMSFMDSQFIALGATLLICWLAIPLCRRWLPYVTAQKDPIHVPTRMVRSQA